MMFDAKYVSRELSLFARHPKKLPDEIRDTFVGYFKDYVKDAVLRKAGLTPKRHIPLPRLKSPDEIVRINHAADVIYGLIEESYSPPKIDFEDDGYRNMSWNDAHDLEVVHDLLGMPKKRR